MSGLLQWAWSFIASEVTVDVVSSQLYCGEKVLLCSIELTNSKASFTTYNKDEIIVKVSSECGSVFERSECEISIAARSDRILDVYCMPKRSGQATVQLDLGIWYTVKGRSQFRVVFHPACPAVLSANDSRYLKNTCRTAQQSEFKREKNSNTSKDPNITVDPKLLYNNRWSTMRAVVLDKYNNVVTKLDGDCLIRLESTKYQGNRVKVTCINAVIKGGRLRLEVKGNGVGKQDFLVTLTSNCNDEYQLKPVELQVIDAPLSLTLSKLEKPDSCVAGIDSKIWLIPFDIFGKRIMEDSTARCNFTCKILDSSRNSKATEKEWIDCSKTVNSSSYIYLGMSVLLTKAGERHFEIMDRENKLKLQFRLEVEPNASNVHWERNIKKTTYKNERLTLTAHLFDNFGNKVVVPDPSSCQCKLLQESGPEDGLKCTKTSTTDNAINIEYHFAKKGTYVLSLHMGTERKSLSIIVQDTPVDPACSQVTRLPKYEDQPLFPDDKSFRCRVDLTDIHGDNYEGEVNRGKLTVMCGMQQAQIIELIQPDDMGSVDVEVSLDEERIRNCDLELKFWFFFDGKKITRPLNLSFDGFKKYDDELITVRESDGLMYCRDVTKREIIGPAYAHLNNIKRVCELDEDPKIDEFYYEEVEYIAIQLPDDAFPKTRIFYATLLHFLKALYYRKKAFEADHKREHWKEMATESYNGNDRVEIPDWNRPTFCRGIKEKYATLMNEYHENACEEYFAFFNTGRNQSEIDLHGLLVADEKKLRDYERQLRGKKHKMSNDQVEPKVEEERKKSDEAIRKLSERLDNYAMETASEDEEPWLEIIVGSGQHSRIKDRQNIRPKVEKYLREKRLPFSPVNKGALVVTFEKYKGREPCFGEYYCEQCNHRWRNRRSWIDKWQACYDCFKKDRTSVVKCFPLKQRLHKKWLPYKPTSGNSRGEIPHLNNLCQKCTDLGHDCSY